MALRRPNTHYPRLALVEDIRTLAPELVTASVNIEYPFTAAERLREALGGCMDVVVSGPADVDLNSPGHNKATGLARLLESWDIDPGHVGALGDNLNDAETLALAGTAVAVANAQPEITAIADIVAPSNDADGALTALEELITRQSLTGRQSLTSR